MIKYALKFSKERIRALKQIALDKHLKGSEVLNEYSDDDIAEAFNGAGGESTPEVGRWILTKILESKLPAIMIHDMAYKKGGLRKDFFKANSDLRDNILALDNGSKSGWWRFAANQTKKYTDEKGWDNWGVS